jgi:hypothetical protein
MNLVLYYKSSKRENETKETYSYSRTPLIRINWDGKPFGFSENSDNWIFPLTFGYMGSLNWEERLLQRALSSPIFIYIQIKKKYKIPYTHFTTGEKLKP